MADMFGTAGGMRAAREDRRLDDAAAMETQKAMSDLAMQPAKQELYRAQAAQAQASAGHLWAETDALETQARDQERLAQISQLVAAKRSQGKIATVNDLEEGRPRSQADYYRELLQEARDQGLSPIITDKLAKSEADIRQSEAAAMASAASQEHSQLQSMQKRFEMRGSFANAALNAGPAQWAQMRQMAVDRSPPGEPSELAKLPQDWNAAVPILRAALDESVKGIDQLKLREQQLQNKAQRANWDNDNAQKRADLAFKEKVLLFRKAEAVASRKNNGEFSPEVQRAIERRALADEAVRKSALDEKFPPLPLDEYDREEGQAYTHSNGGRYLWTINPATGKLGLGVLSPPPGSKAAKEIAATAHYRTGRPPKINLSDFGTVED